MAENVTNPIPTPEPEPVNPVPVDTLLKVKSNGDLAKEQEMLRTKEQQLLHTQALNDQLGQMINTRFTEAENAKDTLTDILMDSLRRRKGVYSAEVMAELKKQGGSQIWMKLTEIKCNAAEAWVSDVAIPVDGKPWSLKPTPKPSLPQPLVEQVMQRTVDELEPFGFAVEDEEIIEIATRHREEAKSEFQKEAKKRAENMENLIDDEFSEGGLIEAMEEAISDLTTLGTMIIRGPFIQYEATLAWDEENNWEPIVSEDPLMKFERVDPLRFFPSPGATTIKDATYVCHIADFTRQSLNQMKGIPSYSDKNIDILLKNNKSGTTIPLKTDSEQATLEDREGFARLENPDEKYQGIWYEGECAGWLLKEWGMTGLDDLKSYEVVALKIGDLVVHCRLNADPLGRRDYVKTVYKPTKGSFWGEGVPQLMSDSQDACNSTARSLINNLAIGSGPQVVINDVESMAEGEDITSMYPWKIWQFNDPNRTGKSPINFTQPQIYTDKLINVFQFFMTIADEETGIPKYEQGSPAVTGAGSTASGLSMLMNSASRILKKSIQNIDLYIFKPLIERAFVWNMIYIPDPDIKGDVKIETQGAMSVFVKEQQQLRLADFTTLTSTPEDRALMGPKRRVRLLRANAEGLSIPQDEVLPTDIELEQEQRELAEQEAQARNAELAQQVGAGQPLQ